MRRLTRLVAILILVSVSIALDATDGRAVPANPVLHSLTQPDGTTFKARQWGDEHLRGWETENGYTITYAEASQTWFFAELDTAGDLVASIYRVGQDLPPPTLAKHLRPRPPPTTTTEAKALTKTLDLNANPPVGTRNVPVLLVNFSDTSWTHTKSEFTNLLFASNTYSMKDYFREVSYNKFDISPGSSGIVDWVTVSKTRRFYGADNSADPRDYDYWVADLVYEVVQEADLQVDFAQYDSDDDCIVDNVMIVHQGGGQESTAIGNDIWSHSWNLDAAKYFGRLHYPGTYITNDVCSAGGYVKVSNYTIQPELHEDGGLNTVGVFAHEYGHAIGLPDLYDTDDTSYGVGIWSLMAAGSWGKVSRSGDRPAHLDAWSKFKLGWVTPTLVSGTLVSEQISQAATNADVYQLRAGTPDSGEYFLVENRQKAKFDAGLPGAGLLIWHIDGAKISTATRTNTVNNSECFQSGNCSSLHYGVSLVQADKLFGLELKESPGDYGDPFPGFTGNFGFNGLTTPNSNLWNGVATNVGVSNISASGPTMTANLSVQDCTYVLSSAGVIHTSTGGAGSFQVQTGSGCAWTAIDNSPWITISNGSSGSGTATVNYNLAVNTTGSSRIGAITVGGLTFNITQSATAANSVLQNGDFEQGKVYWDEYAVNGAPVISDSYQINHSTGGSWSAFLAGYDDAYDVIMQTVTIPDDATQAGLSFYRLITTSESTISTPYDTMQVLVLDRYDASNVLSTLRTYSNLDASSGWIKSATFDLTQFRGQTVRIAFLASTDFSERTSFYIDDVTLTTSNTATISITPTRRVYPSFGGSGSTAVTGTGSWTAQSNSPWITITAGSSGSNSGTVAYAVAANLAQSQRTGTITIAGKVVLVIQEGMSGGQELLVNGSFESGATSGWNQSAGAVYDIIGTYTDFTAHGGSWYAYFADYENAEDIMTQNVSIPSDASNVYLQYYYHIVTDETSTVTEYDQMWVYLIDAGGNFLATLKSYSNLNKTSGWRQSEALDLSAYRGRTVKLAFKAANDFSLNTAFLVDDAQLRVIRDTTSPTVTMVSPLESASQIPVSSTITAKFSEQMIPSTLNSNTFTMKKGTISVVGTITYDSATNTAKLTPQTPLAFGSNYVVTLTTGIKDLFGIGLAAAKIWTFTTQPDTVAPTVTAFSIPSISTALTVGISAFTATDTGGVTGYLVNESSTKPSASAIGWSGAPQASYTFMTAGQKTLYAWAKDAAGNVSNSAGATVTITPPPDIIAPVVVFAIPATSTSLTVPITSLSASDLVGVAGYLVNESPTKPSASAVGWSATPPANYTFTTVGTKTLYAWAKDAAGNVSNSAGASITIAPPPDIIAPFVIFAIPATSTSLTVPITTFSATDNVGVTGYLVTESAAKPSTAATGWSTVPQLNYIFTTAGQKTLYAWAKDAAGNVSLSSGASVTVSFDVTAPIISSFILPAAAAKLTVSGINLAGTDNVGITGWCLTQTNNASSCAWLATKPVSYTFSGGSGQRTLYAFAKDAAGNVSTSRSSGTRLILGDVNGGATQNNGLPSIRDAQDVLRFSVGAKTPTAAERERADLAPITNGVPLPDGIVDIHDVIVILRLMVGLPL